MEKQSYNYINKRKLPNEQIVVETPFIQDDVKKILWTNAFAQIDNIDILNKEVNYSGKVFFDVVFLDNENKIQTYKTTAPFLSKIVNDNITPTSKVIICISGAMGEYIETANKLQAIVDFSVCVINNESVDIISQGDDKFCVKTDAIVSQELIKEDCVLFNESVEYPITDKMENIISVKSKVCLKDIEINDNLFIVKGEVLTTIKYLSTNEEIERILTVNYTENISREIEVDGLQKGDKIDAVLCLKYENYKYELDKEDMKILINVPLELCYRAYGNNAIPCAIDLFSLTNKVDITTNSINKSFINDSQYFEEKIEGSVVINQSSARIDKIIGFSDVNLTITNTTFNNGKINVDGVLKFNFAYLNDESEEILTESMEIPFNISFSVDLSDIADLFVSAEISDVDIIAKRGREVFVDGKIRLLLNSTSMQIEAVITNIENGEELPEKNNAIEIFFGKKGDELWDIAKELKVQPEIIITQNPELVLPLEQNENIIIYNQLSDPRLRK